MAHNGTLYQIDYVVGKSRDIKGAESIAERTDAILRLASKSQSTRVTRIANAFGTYGYRVNVVSEVK